MSGLLIIILFVVIILAIIGIGFFPFWQAVIDGLRTSYDKLYDGVKDQVEEEDIKERTANATGVIVDRVKGVVIG